MAKRVLVSTVSRQLRQVQMESAGGRVDLGPGEQPVRTLATVGTADELRALPIALPDGRSVRLDQVARVTDSVAEPRAAVEDRQAELQRPELPGRKVARGAASAQLQRADVAAQAQARPARGVGGGDLGPCGQHLALGGPHVGALAQGVGGQGCY